MEYSYLKRRSRIIWCKLLSHYYFWVVINRVSGIYNNKVFKNRCLQNLVLATELLNKAGVKYWLTDGTLLGFYRDGDFISGDKDVDIGVFIDDLPDNLLHIFRKNGLYLLRENGSKECGLEYTFTRKGVNLDIFFFYKEKDFVWHAAWLHNQIIKFRYSYFEIKKISALGHEFNAPENIEDYLLLKYGKNWRTPIKKWNWAIDPENIFV
jgi:fukutin